MLKRFIVISMWALALNSCLEPYNVPLDDYTDLLVVDALISNENKSYMVVLSHSVSNIDEVSRREEQATVIIQDQLENKEILTETSPGIYVTDSTQFLGEVGRTYQLYIKTTNGNEYLSDPCLMPEPGTIDSVYYLADKDWDKEGGDEYEGLGIFVDGRGDAAQASYLRWTYNEDWKFRIAYPTREIILPDNTAQPIPVENFYCWKSAVSNSILIHSFQNQVSNQVKGKKINFIATGEYDKITVRYSTLVRQYSISKEEYEFWNQLKESTEDVGDVFGKQPFSISGNIHNMNDPREPVLGYFQVAGVTSKRIYIDQEVLKKMELPLRSPYYACPADTVLVDYISFFSPYQIYEDMVINSSWALVDPLYAEMTLDIIGLLLTPTICADCTMTGEKYPPPFWEEQ